MTSFINQALVFMAASVIMVPLFHRLGLGSVLGYLVAGLLVGPSGLAFINDPASLMHFAELGVVLLLFVIGLEIQPRKLWAMRQNLLGLGGLQVLLCSLVFMGVGLALGLAPLAAGLIGFALSLSSTAFALQTLNEKNQLNTTMGQASFSVLLAQDLLAIPALALIPALAGGAAGGHGPTLMTLVWFLLIVAGLMLLGRFFIRPLFRTIANTRSREIFTATALFLVLGVAALMHAIGLSAALGTFIAGVLLADSEYRHELEANLDPFKGLLMGLFFMAVGMGVALPLILQQPLVVLALTLGYFALKLLLIYGLGRFMGQTHENAKQMALTVGQGGEFAFVIFGLIGTLGLSPIPILELLTVVITLSMILSPLANMAHERWLVRCAPPTVLPKYDEIKDQHPQVVIAGFGRVGQIFGRMLRAQNIPFVAIDHDAEQVEGLRKFGQKVYFGDASRLEILQTAGVASAKFFVLAIDDMEHSLATARTLREHFPHVRVFGRARNRGHVFELMELGVQHIKRETFDSSLNFVGELLLAMGHAPERVSQMVERFRVHDEVMLTEQFKVRTDEDMYISVSTQGQAQLNQVMELDNTQSYLR